MYCLISQGGKRELVYADNAATTKLDIDAYETMKKFGYVRVD